MKDYIENSYQNYSRYVPPVQYNKEVGVYYNERPSPWGTTSSINEALADRRFEKLYNE